MKVYDVERAVFDALPDLTEPRKLKVKYPGIVWLNYYKKEVRKAEFITWDYKTHTCYADRTKIIQQVIDELVDRKIRFQTGFEDLKDYIKHWSSLYKTIEKDNLGIERDVWQSSGEDHLVMATIYWRLALDRVGSGTIRISDGEKEEVRIYDGKAPDIQSILRQQ